MYLEKLQNMKMPGVFENNQKSPLLAKGFQAAFTKLLETAPVLVKQLSNLNCISGHKQEFIAQEIWMIME